MDKDYHLKKLLKLHKQKAISSYCTEVQIFESLPIEEKLQLEKVFKDYYEYPIKKIKENVIFIQTHIISRTSDKDLIKGILKLKELQEFTENLDLALDFTKFGGLNILENLLMDNNIRIKAEACSLLGNINQNNFICQMESINRNLIEKLVEQLIQENDSYLLKKLIYSISCTVRGNKSALERFIQINGVEIILQVLEKTCLIDVRCKIAFFLFRIFSELDTNHIDLTVVEQCFEKLINYFIKLNSFSELEAEYLLGSIYIIMKNYPSIKLKRKKEFSVLMINERNSDTFFLLTDEVIFYSKEILNLLIEYM